ncbi:hypothetical protein CHS0354_028616 [Potamilus streckersoni]|uniref:Uncharacterized protein n=1 Tax=Potamilus streckersoni TaxID=2493646 RepID=A0AAE0RVI5_9BIVA|nr:hypothetical protein CHS0354_028616 [Potamilus streckersoni]
MASAKPELARDGTMQVTAKEGIGYLQAAGKDTLLEMQGLKPSEEDSPMDTADKESDQLHGDNKPDPDSKTRVDQKKIEKDACEPVTKKPKVAKGITMQATAKEAKAMMGDNAPDQDALTRGQQKKIEDIQNEAVSPAKKPRMSKNVTMVNTAKEGKALLEDEKLGDTRAETKSKQEKPAAPKRDSTIKATVREAQYLLQSAAVDVSEGRRTRSQSRGEAPKPAVKKAGTMQATAKEGKEFLQRGKKGRGKKDLDTVAEKEDDAEEEEANKEAEEEAEKEEVEKEVVKKDAKKGRGRGKKVVEAAKEEEKEGESTENA